MGIFKDDEMLVEETIPSEDLGDNYQLEGKTVYTAGTDPEEFAEIRDTLSNALRKFVGPRPEQEFDFGFAILIPKPSSDKGSVPLTLASSRLMSEIMDKPGDLMIEQVIEIYSSALTHYIRTTMFAPDSGDDE